MSSPTPGGSELREFMATPMTGGSFTTLTPTPASTKRTLFVYNLFSQRMPQSFLSPAITSLGSLIRVDTSYRPTALWTASPMRRGRRRDFWGGTSGLRIRVNQSPPRAENQWSPFLPLPAVCSRAITTVPSGAPSSAREPARILVESMVSTVCMMYFMVGPAMHWGYL